MSILGSMFTARTAIDAFGDSMGIAGDNIANLNTVGFKTSRQSFADLLPTVDAAFEVGHGVRLAAVRSPFQQGTIETTASATDLAVEGNGYFVLKDESGAAFYSRAGQFALDKDGDLANPGGLLLQGLGGNISLTTAATIAPRETSQLTLEFNLDASSAPPPAPIPLSSDASQGAWTASSNYSIVAPLFDSAGAQHDVGFQFRKTAANSWDYRIVGQISELDASAPSSTEQRQLGSTGTLVFDANGALDGAASTIAGSGVIAWASGASNTVSAADIDMSRATQYSQASFVRALDQNGMPLGRLNGIQIGTDGAVTARYSNGQAQSIDTVALAQFASDDDLARLGGTLFAPTLLSGAAVTGVPGSGGRGTLIAGGLELSTVDLAVEFIALLTSQRSFQVNSKVITTADEMFSVAADLKR